MDERLHTLRKYNLWDSAPFDFGYGRSGYTDKIAAYTGNRLVKVLVGQRRTGKSYLLADEATVEREYSALEAIADNLEKVVVSLDDLTLPLRGGIRHVQAWKLAELL